MFIPYSKALTGLAHLEYVNFGDCLVRSKGAVLIARSLAGLKNIKVKQISDII